MRPRDLALLLMSSGEFLPRQRIRNQTPDFIGLELKRQLLQSLADLDPEPADLEKTLMRLVGELGPAPGPVRALALSFRDEWHALSANPQWIAHLQTEAAQQKSTGRCWLTALCAFAGPISGCRKEEAPGATSFRRGLNPKGSWV